MRNKSKKKNAITETVAIRPDISDKEFQKFKNWIYDAAGINLADHKKALVMGRLSPRLRHYNVGSYGDYFKILTDQEHSSELQIAVDLLTTNETYFFREPKHFDFLRDEILKHHPPNHPLRIWSAASSTGEEAYSLAMTISHILGDAPWEILASDLSSRVLHRASSGHYSMERARHIPQEYLKKYCLKGVDEHEGTFIITPEIKKRVTFTQINLNEKLPEIGLFDIIVLRNVMIYFNHDTKARVLARLTPRLKPGGYLFIGHSESLNGVTDQVKTVRPAIYRKI